NNFDPVIDEAADSGGETQFAGLAVDHREEDHGEALLHLGVLVELVQHDLRLRSTLELDDDAHAVAIALVADVRDFVDDLFVDQLGDALNELGLVDLVGDLVDDDRRFFLGDLLGGHLGAHEEAAATGGVGLGDAGFAEDEAAGGEIRALHVAQDFEEAGVGIVHQFDGGVEDLGEVVGRDVGRHADGDAIGAVDDQRGDAGGEDGGLGGRLVVVRNEVDRLHVDVGEHFTGNALQAAFGVTHG